MPSDIKRILLIGNSGSGKSSLAQQLVQSRGLAHLDLDRLVWEPGQIAVMRETAAIQRDLQAFIQHEPHWVIEGCYAEWIEAALPHCQELWFLNPGLEICLAHNLQRPWEPHKYASPEAQNSMLAALQEWVRGYYSRQDAWSYHAHRQLFDGYAGGKREWQRIADYPSS